MQSRQGSSTLLGFQSRASVAASEHPNQYQKSSSAYVNYSSSANPVQSGNNQGFTIVQPLHKQSQQAKQSIHVGQSQMLDGSV